MKKLWMKGSMTIEAAAVMPLVMIVITVMLFLAFYVHDQVTMTAVNDYVALENAEKFKKEQDINTGEVSAILNSKLITASGATASLDGSKNKIKIVSAASFSIPVPLAERLTGGIKSIYSEVNLSNMDGRGKLLIYKSICDGVAHLAGNMEKQ